MEHLPGLIEDPRSPEEKILDYQHEEFYAAVELAWMEKQPEHWKRFNTRNQNGSGSCVGQAVAKALETLNMRIMSAHPIYRRRSNFPGFGMWLHNGGDLVHDKDKLKKDPSKNANRGTTTDLADPSQNLSEYEMNRDVTVKTPTLVDAYVFVPPRDIDSIAQAIQTNKHCILTFVSNYDEWTAVPEVKGTTKWGHCVCAVDYTLYNGAKALIVEDSWGPGLGQFDDRRVITEDYLKARCTGAMYLVGAKENNEQKPKYRFNRDLSFGIMHSDEVKALQDCLKFEGLFPVAVESTGNFLEATLAAVKKFQEKYAKEILTPVGKTKGTGYVGPYTRKKLNSLFS